MKRSFSSKGVFPYQWGFTLLIPLRKIFLSPRQLIARMGLKENSKVLEIGPGPGFFTIPVASELKKGELYIADIQQEMINTTKKRAEKRGLTNIRYHLCNGEAFDFGDSLFDIIFLVAVLGEVENRDTYISEFHRMVKPGGVVSIPAMVHTSSMP